MRQSGFGLFWGSAFAISVVASLSACTPSVEDGVKAYESKDYAKAVKVFAARDDDPVSLYYRYKMSRYGEGLPKSDQQALQFLSRAAKKDYPEAMLDYGERLLDGDGVPKDPEGGLAVLEKAGQLGTLEAYAQIGDYYLHHAKVPALGLSYLMKAEGTIDGKLKLADLYESGAVGVQQSPSKALAYWQQVETQGAQASKRGLVNYARLQQAEFYYYGFGGPRNPELAAKTLEPYINDDPDVKNLYAWLLFRGEGVARDSLRATKLWLSNVDEKTGKVNGVSPYPYIYAGLAQAYAEGIGITQDITKANSYFAQINPIYSGEYWSAKMKAEGFLGLPCPYSASVMRLDDAHVGRYRLIAGEASLAVANCLMRKGAKDPLAGTYAGMALAVAARIGANGAATKEHELSIKEARGGVILGMTKQEALASKWGRPERINRTHTASGTDEQWVYGGGNYLYFRNGILESFQN
ncbi:tetratricopeptide repeat protein [Paraburkholderia lacunae]|nr:tetratricopeptide repeat protein [Paraburkholderia lacunae]